jgi:hypothetical protein
MENNMPAKGRPQNLVGNPIWALIAAVHTTLFERLICITKERANIGFLMYLADSVCYTGYIVLMLLRNVIPTGDTILVIFLKSFVFMGIAGGAIVIFCNWYFRLKLSCNDTNGGFRCGRHNSKREHAGV